jgi:hypothetical protein
MPKQISEATQPYEEEKQYQRPAQLDNVMSRDASPYSKAEYTPTHGARQESIGGRPPIGQYERYDQQQQ